MMVKKKILIADDEPMVTDFLAELLSVEGHDIVVAESPDKAVSLAKQEDFHLILVDANMPRIEGASLYLKLKELKKNKITPMMIISGSGLEPSLAQAIKKGVDTFIQKPSEIGLIRERVKQCLARFEDEAERKRILVVDDNPMSRDFLTEFLTGEGYKVVSTAKGDEALEMVGAQKFHLILADIDMPRIKKATIPAKIKDLTRKKPVPMIVMSGSGLEPSLIKALKKGMDDYILKPFELDFVREKIKRCLKKSAKKAA